MKTRMAALTIAGLSLLLGMSAGSAEATVVTSLPGGTVISMPALEYFGPGPQTFGPGITWSSTNATVQSGSVFGYTGVYSFLSNGSWNGALGPMAGLNDSSHYYDIAPDTMTFAFSSPVYGVGGFMNYVPDFGDTTVIAVYDSSFSLLESATLTFSTGGGDNTGMFLAFQESSPISYFTLTDGYVGITNLTTLDSAPVPEPGTLLLLGAGVLSLVARRRHS